MIELLNASIQPANGGNPPQVSGLDLMASIQILLIQDYDNQLQSLQKRIKGTVDLKKAYRGEIEAIHKALSQKTEKKGGKDTVLLDASTFSELSRTKDFTLDGENSVVSNATYEALGYVEAKTETRTSVRPAPRGIGNPQVSTYQETTGYYVERDVLEKKLETYKLKLDSLNEQSELLSLSLQSLTNQRKIAFETVSNLISKEQEGMAGIIRNIKN